MTVPTRNMSMASTSMRVTLPPPCR
uniref:Uncharacterized protein n=1 Tax=Arundo donax TaxID=35708 RepID=A0A0A9C5D0_ARUDO